MNFIDGGFDGFHYGHVNALYQAQKYFVQLHILTVKY